MGTKARVLKSPKRKRDTEKDLDDWRKEARKTRKALESLTTQVRAFIVQLDTEMQQPSSVERGGRVSKLLNALEMANDSARYFALHVDPTRDNKALDVATARVILPPWSKLV